MGDYSKDVEKTTTAPKEQQEQMLAIGLERIKFQKEKQQHTTKQ